MGSFVHYIDGSAGKRRPAIRPATVLPALAIAAGLTGYIGSAAAHPHVWVTNEATIIFDNGTITGLRYRWLFDEIYTVSALEGLDKNNDGKFDRSELEELTKINTDGLKEYDYFTSATLAGAPVGFGDPLDAVMEVVEVEDAPGPQLVLGPEPQSAPSPSPAPGGASPGATASPAKQQVLAIEYTLPLTKPILAEAKGFQFTVQDSQMFIWFQMPAKGAVKLAGNVPKGCVAHVRAPEMDEEQKKLQAAFGGIGGDLAIGGGARMVTVECPGP